MKLSICSAALLICTQLLCSAHAQTVIYDGSQDLNFFSASRATDDLVLPIVQATGADPNVLEQGDGAWLRSSGRRMRNVDSANMIGLASSAAGVDGTFMTANPTATNPDPNNAADRDARGTGAGFFLNDGGATTGLQTLNFSLYYNDPSPNGPGLPNDSGGSVAVRVYGIQNSSDANDLWKDDDFTFLASTGFAAAFISAGNHRGLDDSGDEPVVDRLLWADSSFDPERPVGFDLVPSADWQDVSFQFDAGTGYDWLLFAFGGVEQDDTNLPADRYGFDNVSFESAPDLVTGDFDGNGVYECADVDQLVVNIATNTGDTQFDLTGDGNVDIADLDEWRAEAGSVGGLTASGNPLLPGDANLDGEVDGQDFVIWNANKFTDVPAWCSGDFNADGSVNGQDFVIWNASKFQSANDSLAAVPEPHSFVTLLLLALLTIRRQR